MDRLTVYKIKQYFLSGHRYEVIRHLLKKYDRISVSLRTIKRSLATQGLKRNGVSLCLSSDIVVNAINEIQRETGNRAGYRRTWKIVNTRRSIRVTQEAVRQQLLILNPAAVQSRVSQVLTRRSYRSSGPNHVWHCDGYDKLKPFGFCIHGCIDGFSRKLLWLSVATSNNDPKVILHYFRTSVLNQNGCPTVVRSDCGTETGLLAAAQCTLRHNDRAHVFGPSYHNQRIEAWWSVLRRSWTQMWMDMFDDLISFNAYNACDPVQKSIAEFCFMNIIQNQLDEYRDEWNSHRIRRTYSSGCPGGIPNELYLLPELHGFTDREKQIVPEVVRVLLATATQPQSFSNQEIHSLCHRLITVKGWSLPHDRDSALVLYLKIHNTVYRDSNI